MTKIKQLLKDAPMKFHICVMIFCLALIFVSAWVYANVSHLMFWVILASEIVIFFVDAYYAINRAVEDYLKKSHKICLNEIKTFLPNYYVPIYLFRHSEMDKSLTYYGKINEDNTLSVYGESDGVKKECNEFKKNYMWFMKNFFTI